MGSANTSWVSSTLYQITKFACVYTVHVQLFLSTWNPLTVRSLGTFHAWSWGVWNASIFRLLEQAHSAQDHETVTLKYPLKVIIGHISFHKYRTSTDLVLFLAYFSLSSQQSWPVGRFPSWRDSLSTTNRSESSHGSTDTVLEVWHSARSLSRQNVIATYPFSVFGVKYCIPGAGSSKTVDIVERMVLWISQIEAPINFRKLWAVTFPNCPYLKRLCNGRI